MALIDSTGNTHGIRFRIRPPRIGQQHENGQCGGGAGRQDAASCGDRRSDARREPRARRDRSAAGAGERRLDLHRHGDRILAALLGREQHAANRAGLRRLIADLHRELDGIARAGQRLRRAVLDAAVVIRIERQRLDLRQRRAPIFAEAEHQPAVANTRAGRGRLRGRQLAARRGEQRRDARVDGAGRGLHGQPQLQGRRFRGCRHRHIPASSPLPASASAVPALRSGAAVICTRCIACLA